MPAWRHAANPAGDLLLSEDEDEEARRARNRRRRGGLARQGSGARLQRTAACVRAHHNIITAYNPVTQVSLLVWWWWWW